MPVADAQQKTSLTRTMRVGDELSIDNRRIVIVVDGVDRKRCTVKFRLDQDVKVDKPPKKPPA
jgi:hypothetical protein